MNLVSVVIPYYNQPHYVTDAIRSVLNQTYKKFEIIIVDDGSTDYSREVLSAFEKQITCIRQTNQGLAGARNTGIKAARGELIGLLDADDLWCSTYLEQMLSLIHENPDAAAYYCAAQAMDADGNELPQVFGGPAIPSNMMYQTLLRANFLIPSTIILRRPVITAVGLFDQTLRHCEDWDLWLRILPQHNFVGSSKCLVRYRLHVNSLSADATGQQQTTRVMIEHHFGPDDGQPQNWVAEKRRAYGGVYRLCVLTSIQRQNDWEAAKRYLKLALHYDPTLAVDLSLFYDLALGNQPPGYRGVSQVLEFDKNASHLTNLIENVFNTQNRSSLRRKVFGTALYALGLISYNFGTRALSKFYFAKALYYRPDLLFKTNLVGNLFKSFFSRETVKKMKKIMWNS